MTLKPGTRLGPYEILSLLGAGGMGEVYKGRDTRLERMVALKVLPSHLASVPQARERFEREARTVANLKHPHICVLYDIGEQSGIPGQPAPVHYLVMEYLEGETLALRLMKGPLPLEQVFRYATEIADALDKAHRKGATHRDIKPGNIMLTKEGSKLLDFGLAKLKQEATKPNIPFSQMPTEPSVLPPFHEAPGAAGRGTGLTADGTVLGTVQYMAPEQVEGKIDDIDGRTDIFSFGATVYEMATGRKAFEGKSQASVFAAILKEDPPPMSSLQPMTPPALDEAVKRCLAKDPDDRWQTARDMEWELKRIAGPTAQGAAPAAAARRRIWDRLGWAAAAVVAIIAVALAVLYFRSPSTTDSSAIRFSITPTTDATVGGTALAVSPNGNHVAFIATDASGKAQLWVRALDSPEAQPLAGTEGTAGWGPFWSPDSRFIGFFAGGKLKTIPISAGPVQILADAFPRGGTWNREGTILFTPGLYGGLARVSAAGGPSSPVTTTDPSRGERSHRSPQFLPDGRHFLYFSLTDQRETSGIYVGSLDSKETKHVLPTNVRAEYTTPGYLLYIHDRTPTLMAQPFDAARLELTGEPSIIANGVAFSRTSGVAGFSVSERGVLAYGSGGPGVRRLLWYDRTGKQLSSIEPPGPSNGPELSPDGKKVAVEVGGGEEPNDIWLLELDRGISTRFTSDPGNDRYARWSPDGSRILFHSNRAGGVYNLYQKLSSGAGNEELVFQDNTRKYPYDWSSDGRYVVYAAFGTGGEATAELWVLPLFGERKPFSFVKTKFEETQGQFSPDGRWMAFVSNESGRDEVYLSGFPTASGKIQVSTNGGVQPRWRRDGKELFYFSRDRKLMAVSVKGDPTLEVGSPQALFEVRFNPLGTEQPWAQYAYDVTADGQRFLVSPPPANATVPITVVLNWTAGLKKQ